MPFGDLDALRAELARGDVAALIVEPVQGKGVYLAPDGYLAGAQQACREAGALLIADEVQTGLGRTGRFLAFEHWGIEPDLVPLSKSLSGGYVPLGALLCSRAVFDATFDSMERSVVHGSTFGNGEFAAAAGLATLDVIEREQLVERAASMGALLMELTLPFVERFEIVREVRGLGLIWAIELGPPSGRAARRLWDAIERRQPGLFAQTITVPLFREHRILTQVAGPPHERRQGAAAADGHRGSAAVVRRRARGGAGRGRAAPVPQLREPRVRARAAELQRAVARRFSGSG